MIVVGESAGGTLALQSGFLQPPGVIKAVVATYPGLEIGAKRDKPVLGAPIIPKQFLDDFLANMKPGEIVTSAHPPTRFLVALSLTQQVRTREFYETDDRFFPARDLETVEYVPFIFLVHGRDDTAVPVAGSVASAERVRERFGSGKVDLQIEQGDDGFDDKATLEMPWLKEGLSRVTELWLGATEE